MARPGLIAAVAVLGLAACGVSDARPVAVSTVATTTTTVALRGDAIRYVPRPSFVRLIPPAAASRGVPRQRPRATPPPVVRQPTIGSVDVIGAIHAVFGAAGDSAARVAKCESGFNPRAVSPGGSNLGLFQVNRVHRRRWEAMGYSAGQMLEAEPNTRVAYAIFREQGWSPWACRWAA